MVAQGQNEHGAEPRGLNIARTSRGREGRFGLMFKNLPAFEPSDDLLRQLAAAMTEAAGGAHDNPQTPAGFTFFGQFVDHDLTRDTTPLQVAEEDPDATTNFRSARYDLDSVYGQGPTSDPDAAVPFDPNDPDKLLIGGSNGPGTADQDLPRRPDTRLARIGDPRNEENLIIAQMQLAFLKFHNAMVDHVRAHGASGDEVFAEAQRLARWHYQWVVVHDFVGRVIGRGMLDQILEERPNRPAKVTLKFYKPGNPNRPMMPLEFAVAAYRFGHSMIRPGYRVNDQAGGVFFGPTPTNSNLNGFRPIPAPLVIGWEHFYEIVGQPAPQPARRIDAALSGPLFTLPESVVPIPDDPTIERIGSLAHRNLLRGKRVGLPSGQQVAEAMGAPVLTNQDLGVGSEPGWAGQAPLWYYILKEAELQHNGLQLGEVGGRIVGEVLVGLLERDQSSYLRRDPRFRPEPPIAPAPGQFAMGDLLRFAGAV